MNMRWYDRFLVSLSGLILAALGCCVILAGGGVIELPGPLALDAWLGTGWQWMPILFLVGLLFLVWGGWLILRPFMRGDASGRYYTVHDGGDGDVHISSQALDHLVHKCIAQWNEVLTCHVKIGGQENAMRIQLRATILSDARIPELVAEMRAEIKQYVERCAGVTVESVRILVEATKDTRGREAESAPKLPASSGRLTADPLTFEKVPAWEGSMEHEEPTHEDHSHEPVRTVWTPEPEPSPEPVAAHEDPEPVYMVDANDDGPPLIPLSNGAFPFPEMDEPYAENEPERMDDDAKEESRDA